MHARRGHSGGGRLRRAAVTVFVAISMTMVIGFAALAIDIGTLYSAQAELQRTADASALAAAGELINGSGDAVEDSAVEAAGDVAELNAVMRRAAGLDSAGDVEFGKAQYDGVTGKFTFASGVEPYDAVRVTVRRAENSAAGPIQLAFSRMLGHETRDLEARAAAVLIPRDVSVVIDLSNSMNWDSQLRFWNRSDGGCANTKEIWQALDGPEPPRPYTPGCGSGAYYDQMSDSGPSLGAMPGWGNELTPGSYSITGDPGLWKIQKNQTQTLSAITDSLTARGYPSGDRTIIMSNAKDSTSSHWRNRCGVMLGLATWHSGRTGGLPGTPYGDGDSTIESSECTWLSYPSYRGNWTWSNYIDFVQSSSGFTDDATNFRYRYGLKTFIQFLLEDVPEHNSTTNLWATPQFPLRAIKDAVQSMTDVIEAQDNLDKLSLEIFASSGRHEVNLTDDLQSIPDLLYERQSGHYDRATNIGAGLQMAINELTSARARPNAHKVIMLMSDGVPNVDAGGNAVGDGGAGAMAYAREMAQQAHDLNFRIYTVSVGFYADRELMQEIAAIGGGIEFYAAGNPEEYTEQLQDIFRTLGGKRPVALIE